MVVRLPGQPSSRDFTGWCRGELMEVAGQSECILPVPYSQEVALALTDVLRRSNATTSLNRHLAFHVQGACALDRVRDAVYDIAQRHAALRVCFAPSIGRTSAERQQIVARVRAPELLFTGTYLQRVVE